MLFKLNEKDPESKLKHLKNKVEDMVKKVFNLKRVNDAAHQADQWLTGGMCKKESKNKELDEKIDFVYNVLEKIAGKINTISEIKISP